MLLRDLESVEVYLLFMASFKGELLPNVKFEIDRLCGA